MCVRAIIARAEISHRRRGGDTRTARVSLGLELASYYSSYYALANLYGGPLSRGILGNFAPLYGRVARVI